MTLERSHQSNERAVQRSPVPHIQLSFLLCLLFTPHQLLSFLREGTLPVFACLECCFQALEFADVSHMRQHRSDLRIVKQIGEIGECLWNEDTV